MTWEVEEGKEQSGKGRVERDVIGFRFGERGRRGLVEKTETGWQECLRGTGGLGGSQEYKGESV